MDQDDFEEKLMEIYHSIESVIERLYQNLDVRCVFLAYPRGSVLFETGKLGTDIMAFEVWLNQHPTIQAKFQSSVYEPGNCLVFASPEFGFLHFTHLLEGLLLVVGLKASEVSGTELIGAGARQIRELLAEQFQLIVQNQKGGTGSPSSGSGGSQNSPTPLGLWVPRPVS